MDRDNRGTKCLVFLKYYNGILEPTRFKVNNEAASFSFCGHTLSVATQKPSIMLKLLWPPKIHACMHKMQPILAWPTLQDNAYLWVARGYAFPFDP